jgi:hypothetical protein
MAIWNILRAFWIFYDHLVHFEFIWYIFSGFGIMDQEKSGNPGPDKIAQIKLGAKVLLPYLCSSSELIELTRLYLNLEIN